MPATLERAAADAASRPFRWDFSRPEQLPAAARAAEPSATYAGFRHDLRHCVARTLRAAGDADWAFVGRSPESLMDYLAGATAGTPHARRVAWLNVSLKWDAVPLPRDRVRLLRGQLAGVGLDPFTLARRPRPVALIDLMYEGQTFALLCRALHEWTREARGDWPAVRRKLRVVGVQARPVARSLPGRFLESPAASLPVRPVAVPYRLWTFLADEQPKCARGRPPQAWDDPDASRPPRGRDAASAANRALRLRRLAADPPERGRLVAALADEGALRQPFLRRLAHDLRLPRGSRPFAAALRPAACPGRLPPEAATDGRA